MKKIILMLLFATFLSANSIAFVKNIIGDVKVKRNDSLQAVEIKEKLYEGDILITSSNSYVGIIFEDGSTITLGEKSYLSVEAFVFKPIEEEFKFNLELKKGRVVFESGKISKLAPDKFEFKIPEGVIGIRGTKFIVEAK